MKRLSIAVLILSQVAVLSVWFSSAAVLARVSVARNWSSAAFSSARRSGSGVAGAVRSTPAATATSPVPVRRTAP